MGAAKTRRGRPPQYETKDSLAKTYRSMEEKAGLSITEAISKVNNALDRKYTTHRWREYERGIQRPDPALHNYLLQQVLPELLKNEFSASRQKSKALYMKLRLAEKEKG